MSRTNVVIDDELVARVKELYGLRTTREAIDFALRSVAGASDQLAMLEMKGSGWDGDLAEMRRSEANELAMVAESEAPSYRRERPPAARRPNKRKHLRQGRSSS